MAKAKNKGNRGSKAEFSIRRVGTKEDRRRPSVFMRLKVDEAFKGVALFEPDPEAADNPGYYEYYDHYDKQGNAYVPCAGEKCPFCAANDNPSTRALTVWHFPEAADVKDQLKVFTMNYSTINDISDEAEEEDGLMGKTVRIKRLSDKGDYKVKVITGKPLSKKEISKLMKMLEEKFPDGLEGLVLRQLKQQMERLRALDALDDDDEDDEEVTPKSKKGKPVVDEDDDDDDEDEDEVDDDDEDDDDDSDDEEESDDDDDDDEDESDDEEADDDEEEDEVTEIEAASYEVVKTDEKEETFDLKNADGKVKMWLGQGVEVDYDEVKKGATVTVSALQDSEGDWIITEIEVEKKKATKTKSTKGKSKSSKKK